MSLFTGINGNKKDKNPLNPKAPSCSFEASIERTLVPLNMEAQKTLYSSLMFLPKNMVQLIPPLHKYTHHEIEAQIAHNVKSPPHFDFSDKLSLPFPIPFDVEEDFAIVTMIRLNTGPFSFDFVSHFSYMFNPVRTEEEIATRLEEIRLLSDEERENILRKFTNNCLSDYLLSHMIEQENHAIICPRPKYPKIPVLPVIDQEIETLCNNRWLFLKNHFKDDDLALIRTEKHEYFMKQRAILFGRSTEDNLVDIDLSIYMRHGCFHISRKQAILSFQEDMCFYIENIGIRAFRVNGVLIHPGRACVLRPGAILDFSDVLLIFIPNEILVEKIKRDFGSSSVAAPANIKKKKRMMP